MREKYNKNLTEEIKTIIDRVPDKFSKDDKYFTICHGNLTVDNIMFRYNNGVPVDMRIIGWNEMQYTLPGIDFHYIITDELLENIDKLQKPKQSIRKYDIQTRQQLVYCYPFISLQEIESICFNFID